MKFFLRIAGAIIALIAVGLAILLLFFATPTVPEETLRAMYAQAPSQFLKLPSGTSVHFRDYAPADANKDAPVIVLLHGSNASLHTWEPWAQRLRATMRVVTVDLPGHGLTGTTVENDYSIDGMATFVDTFTRAMGLDRPFVLAGNSMGGHIAWRFALAHPDRVSRLVLVDAGGVPPPDMNPPMPLAFRLAGNPITAVLVRRIAPRSLFESTLKKAFYDQALVTPEMVDRYWELNRREGTPAATIARFRLPRYDPAAIARLKEIKAPTLVLWGRQDGLISAPVARKFGELVPQAKIIVYDHCGHLPMEELPDRSAADVRAFVESDR